MAGASSKVEARQRRAFGLLAAAILGLTGLGCGQGDPFPAPPGGGEGGNKPGGPHTGPAGGFGTKVATGACAVEEEVRECHVLIGQHAGITNCFNGIQRCVSGVWTRCQEGTYSVKAHVSPNPFGDKSPVDGVGNGGDEPAVQVVDQKTLEEVAGGKLYDGSISEAPAIDHRFDEDRALDHLLTTTGSCNDPCDPTCQRIIENTPYTTGGVALSAWAAAASAALPNRKATFVSTSQPALWVEPCAVAEDCEFGMICTAPVTRNLGTGPGQCAHDKCALGAALDATCGDPCVAKVCAQNPDCCTYTGPCAAQHSPCLTGAALNCPADPAVANVCNPTLNPTLAYCCDTTTPGTWDAACVTQYGVEKGAACPSDPTRAWTSPGSDPALGAIRMSCTQLVHDACDVICPNVNPTCEHDLCATGAGLTSGCDVAAGDCVAKVCALNSACCGSSGTWAQACIDAIPQACGKACAANAGACRLLLPNEVDTECIGADLIATTPCFDGNAFTPPGNLNKACASNANCGSPAPSGTTCDVGGTNTCRKACSTDSDCVVSAGGVVCDSGYCVAGCHGTGAPCPGGFTCTSTTAAYGECRSFRVPGNSTPQSYAILCNIGTQPTAAGVPVTVNVYGGNATTPTSWPAMPPATPTNTCSTATIGSPAILPGKCIDLPCTIAKNDQIFVNPPGPGRVSECHNSFENNWSMNIDGTARVACDSPICSLQNGTLRSLKTHVVIEAENSSAMQANTWTGIRSGIVGWLANNLGQPWTSADVSMALGYFPDAGESCTATGGGSCSASPDCIKYDMGKINIISAIISAFLTFSQPSMSAPPPYFTALKGALEHARADQLTQVPGTAGSEWNEAVIFVMGSDVTAPGNNYCGSTVTTLSGLAAEYYAKYGIRTFVVAVGAAKLSSAQAIASAGGGNAYYVANDANTGTNLQAALFSATAYANQACSFTLPPVSLFDVSNTTVSMIAPAGPNTTTPNYRYGSVTSVTQVTPLPGWSSTYSTYLEACLANCSNLPSSPTTPINGWCYDDPTSPTKMVLCADTCRLSGFDPYASLTSTGAAHSQVTYGLACPSYYANITYPTPGAYQGICPDPGMKPLWSYLGYDTVDPVNTSVVFQFQTAQAVNGVCPPLGAFPPPNPYTVNVGPANQTCTIPAGPVTPSGGCPVDLVNAMNGGKINGPMLADCLNLTVTLNPNPQHTLTPTVNGFELRYSCPYVE